MSATSTHTLLDRILLKGHSIRRRLVVFFSFFIVISLGFAFAASMLVYSPIIRKQIVIQSRISLESKALQIDSKMRQFDIISYQVASNPEIRRMLVETYSTPFAAAVGYNHGREILQSTIGHREMNELVSLIVTSSQNHYYYGAINRELFMHANAYYDTMVRSKGGLSFINPRRLDFVTMEADCFGIGRLVRDWSTGEIGYVLMLIDVRMFSGILREMRSPPNSLFTVLTDQNEIIFTNALEGSTANEQLSRVLLAESHSPRDRIITLDGIPFVLISHRSGYTGWRITEAVPLLDVIEIMTTSALSLVAISAAFLLAAVFIATRISRDIGQPIMRLSNVMNAVSSGDLDSRIPIEGGIEIEALCKCFNDMLDRINALIRQNRRRQLQAMRTELAFLQAQVNPHFLLNSLNSIRWLAIMNRQNQIRKQVDSISVLLHGTFKNVGALVPLATELDMVDSYIAMMKVRYSSFTIRYEISTEATNVRLPRFTLQPFVENAIIHGFRNIDYLGSLVIEASVEEDRLVVKILDDGTGIGEREMIGVSTGEAHGRIGIANVRRRLQLRFGAKSVLTVRPREPRGTQVEIRLPVRV